MEPATMAMIVEFMSEMGFFEWAATALFGGAGLFSWAMPFVSKIKSNSLTHLGVNVAKSIYLSAKKK